MRREPSGEAQVLSSDMSRWHVASSRIEAVKEATDNELKEDKDPRIKKPKAVEIPKHCILEFMLKDYHTLKSKLNVQARESSSSSKPPGTPARRS